MGQNSSVCVHRVWPYSPAEVGDTSSLPYTINHCIPEKKNWEQEENVRGKSRGMKWCGLTFLYFCAVYV